MGVPVLLLGSVAIWWWMRGDGFRHEVPLGLEGAALIEFVGPELEPAPYEEGAPVTVRLDSMIEKEGARVYDLRYIVLVPGVHDLRKYLRTVDGSPMPELPRFEVDGVSVLGDTFDGKLKPAPRQEVSIVRSYYRWLVLVAVAWVVWLVVVILWGRKLSGQAEAVQREPTLAELLRPLIELARQGKLEVVDKVTLDRLLIRYWREDLHLTEYGVAEALARVRSNPEAGRVLVNVEQWLHAREDVHVETVVAMLEPYCEEKEGENLLPSTDASANRVPGAGFLSFPPFSRGGQEGLRAHGEPRRRRPPLPPLFKGGKSQAPAGAQLRPQPSNTDAASMKEQI